MIRKLIPMVTTSVLIIALFVPWAYAGGADPTWTQTTEAEFNLGTLSDVDTSTSSGDVMLDLQGLGSWSANLLTNPGAEDGDTSSWTAIGSNPGDFSVGTAPSNADPGAAPNSGSYCFFWDPLSASDDWAYQEVDLSGYAGYIAAGRAQIRARGYLVSSEYQASPPYDQARMRARLYTAGHALISTPWDTGLRNLSSWTLLSATFTPATNTGYVRFFFQTIEPGYDAGSADDLSCQIRVNPYYSSGTLASQVLNTGTAGSTWDQLSWDETLPANTDITFKVRASDTIFDKDAVSPSWIDLGTADSPVTTGLPSGQYMQWQATLSTTDASQTPVLEEVRLTYTTNDPPYTPTLNSPADGATSVVLTPDLVFNYSDPDTDDCTSFDLQVDDNSDFSSPEIDETGYSTGGPWSSGSAITYPVSSPLAPNTQYYWMVRVFDGAAWSNWSDGTWDFTTQVQSGGATKGTYRTNEDVEVSASGFPPNSDVDIYVVNDRAWSDGDSIPADVGDGMDTIQADGSGDLGPVVIWSAPLDVGEYDVVFDADQNGDYDEVPDLVDHPNHPGFTVISPTVGGEVYPINKASVLMPWIGLTLVLILALGGGTLALRRSRTR